MELYKEIDNVKTKEDFVKFLGLVAKDNIYKQKEWENKTIPEYLESIQSWIEDMDGYYKNNFLEVPTNVNWGFLATVFYVGKIYE